MVSLYLQVRKKFLSFFHSHHLSFSQLSSLIPSSHYIYFKINIYFISTLSYVIFILVLQYIISTNCSEDNSHILNLKLFI